jgi:hypothetical protein
MKSTLCCRIIATPLMHDVPADQSRQSSEYKPTAGKKNSMANMVWTGAIAGTIAVVAAAAAFGYSSMVDSPSSSGGTSGRPGGGSDAQLLKYDTDKDGRVTRQEVDTALSVEFRGVDTNADGRLDAAEIQRHIDVRRTERSARIEAWRAKAKSQGLDPSRPPFDLSERDNVDSLRYGDWNMDGVITVDEFGGRTRAQFMRSDRNGDGMVSPEEAHRRRDAKPARGV